MYVVARTSKSLHLTNADFGKLLRHLRSKWKQTVSLATFFSAQSLWLHCDSMEKYRRRKSCIKNKRRNKISVLRKSRGQQGLVDATSLHTMSIKYCVLCELRVVEINNSKAFERRVRVLIPTRASRTHRHIHYHYYRKTLVIIAIK